MDQLPADLYRAATVRELDRILIDAFGIPGIELMERAGRSAFDHLLRRWPEAQRIGVVCGSGNNAGDGYVVARLARLAGLEVRLLQVSAREPVGEAATAFADARAVGIPITPFDKGELGGLDVIVDALLGTGASGEVSGAYAEAIDAINAASAPVLALDLPSGLHADTGAVLGRAIEAELTVSFIGLKQGLFTGRGQQYCGEIAFSDLGAPAAAYERVPVAARRLDSALLAESLPPRRRDAHKGRFGHVLVIGGDYGMAGAARLAAEAAARCGAGLVSVATRPEHLYAFGSRPELLANGVSGPTDLAPLFARASVVAVGPGLGRTAWGRGMWRAAVDSGLPLVVDADGLNLLAEAPLRRDDWILTPHPGEAARLLKTDTGQIQQDRFTAAEQIAERYGGIAVLKGSGTLVVGGGCTGICSAGNPGMASGGMGDLLTGVIAALLAQRLAAPAAARVGVCLHAVAADRAALEGGERGLLGSDLLPHLRRLANPQ